MNSTSERLRPLLDPRSIVVVGASANFARLGGIPVQSMLQSGFPLERLLLVNPKYEEIGGIPCHPSIESLPFAPDLAVLAVPAEQVVPTLRKCVAKGIPAATVFASGFAEERSEDAQRLQAQLLAFAQEGDMELCGPNCVGHINFHSGAYATFLKHPQSPGSPGPIAVMAQSGNMAGSLWNRGREAGLGFSCLVNTGNEVGIDLARTLEYFAADANTRAVVGYIEQVRDGARFLEAAVRMREEGKALFVVKSGTSEKGAEAAASHTAAMAGSDVAYRAAFAQTGVLTATDPARLIDLVRLWQTRARPVGARVCIGSLSGAGCVLVADHCARAGLDVPTLGARTQEALRKIVPSYGNVSNPIDFTGQVINDGEGFFPAMLDAVLSDPDIDAAVFYIGTYVLDTMAPHLAERAPTCGKTIVVIDTGVGAKSHAQLEAAGVPVFTDIDRAVSATAKFLQWSRAAAAEKHWRPSQRVPVEREVTEAPEIIAARRAGRTLLTEVESKQLLARAGLPMVREAIARTAEEAASIARDLGFPVAVKVVSAQIAHKTEVGGVALNMQDESSVRAAFTRIVDGAGQARPDAVIEGVVVQPMVGSGQPVLVGVVRDPVFGPMMTVGLGGVLTELYQDVAHRLLPVDATMAEEMLRELRSFPVLDGYRGSPLVDRAALVRCMASLSRFVLEQGDAIEELELNPVLVRPLAPATTDGVLAVDALIRLRSVT